MTTRMQLTITYKNGNKISQLVKGMKMEAGRLMYLYDTQAHGIIESSTSISLQNIDSYVLEPVQCNGWKVITE